MISYSLTLMYEEVKIRCVEATRGPVPSLLYSILGVPVHLPQERLRSEMIGSHKKEELEQQILEGLSGAAEAAAVITFADQEVRALQEYANVVSMKRLGINDHGPVHMRITALNALLMLNLLKEEGVRMNLEVESGLSPDDSRTAVFLGSMLHDVGMCVERDGHEEYALILAVPLIDRILQAAMPDSLRRRVAVRSTVMEAIAGHMTHRRVSSIEAGLVLVGDGCDMEHGRSRIPRKLSMGPQVGDIHRYSASSVEKVVIDRGTTRPIRIGITMSEHAGFFQVEKVLFPKINASPVKPYIELFAGVRGQEKLQYL